jgi:hypothetical protein
MILTRAHARTRWPPDVIIFSVTIYAIALWVFALTTLRPLASLIHIFLTIFWFVQKEHTLILACNPVALYWAKEHAKSLPPRPYQNDLQLQRPYQNDQMQQSQQRPYLPKDPQPKFQWLRKTMSAMFRSKAPPPNNVDQKESTDEKSTNNENLACIVCFDEIVDTLLRPCNHLQVCQECSQTLVVCPTCRQPIVEKIKVFATFT